MTVRTRIAAVAVAVTAITLLIPSAAFAAGEAPEPPARAELTAENAGSVGIEQEGSRVTVTTDAEEAYTVVYPDGEEPVAVGWQEPADGAFGIDLSLMPAGEVAVALLDADGDVLGWASTELAEEDSHAPESEQPAPSPAEPAPVWPWLLGGGVLVLLVAGGIVLFRKRSAADSGAVESEQAPAEPGAESEPGTDSEQA